MTHETGSPEVPETRHLAPGTRPLPYRLTLAFGNLIILVRLIVWSEGVKKPMAERRGFTQRRKARQDRKENK